MAGAAAWAAGTAAWAAGTAAWAAGTAAWSAGTEANKDRTDGTMEQRSAANLGCSNRDVGGPSRVVGGSDHSGVAGTAAWAAGTAAGAAGTAVWDRSVGGRDRRGGRPGGGFCVSAVSVADDGWEHCQQGPYRRCYRAEAGRELGARRPGGGGRLVERFPSFRVQHLAVDWVDQQPVGGQEV